MSAIEDLRASVREIQRRQRELAAALEEITCQMISRRAAQIFGAHPDLEMFAWSQFSGDYSDEGPPPGMEVRAVRISGSTFDEHTDEEFPHTAGASLPSHYPAISAAVSEFVAELDPEPMFRLFADRSIVVATRSLIAPLEGANVYGPVDWNAVS
jgi:hypothetical protein